MKTNKTVGLKRIEEHNRLCVSKKINKKRSHLLINYYFFNLIQLQDLLGKSCES